jgi:hypothetical protein
VAHVHPTGSAAIPARHRTQGGRPLPTEEAAAALALAFITSVIRHLDAQVPGMQRELLPAFMPPWLLDLVQGGLQQGGAA